MQASAYAPAGDTRCTGPQRHGGIAAGHRPRIL